MSSFGIPLNVASVEVAFVLEGGGVYLFPTVVDESDQEHVAQALALPYGLAKELHNQLGQYLIQQKLYEEEFRGSQQGGLFS